MNPAELSHLGISDAAARAYLAVLDRGHHCGSFTEAARQELYEAGLVGEVEDDGAVRLNDPRRILRAEARRRRQQADTALHLGHELGSLWDRSTAQGHEMVEVLHGRAAVRRTGYGIQLAAQHRIRSIDGGPIIGSGHDQMCPVQVRQLPRGISYQTVYSGTAVADTAVSPTIARAIAMGEEARVHTSLPLRLRLVDESAAIIILMEDQQTTGILVHPSPLLELLGDLFTTVWAASVPLSSPPDGDLVSESSALAIHDHAAVRELVRLMATGITDDQMARHLGISRRTLSRRIQHLLEVTGSATRFQLGVQAARRGWLV